jgi:hypothetical protein
MKKLFASLAVVLIVAQAKAANVHILDAGINPSHYSYIQDRIIAEGCYSYSGTDDLSFTDRGTGVTVYEYKTASLCRNERSTMRGPNAAIIRTTNLPGQRGGNFPPINIPVLQRFGANHQAMVGSTIKDFTSSAVKQWHTNIYSLRGKVGDDNLAKYTRHDAFEY